jgi:hypothetical protein
MQMKNVKTVTAALDVRQESTPGCCQGLQQYSPDADIYLNKSIDRPDGSVKGKDKGDGHDPVDSVVLVCS